MVEEQYGLTMLAIATRETGGNLENPSSRESNSGGGEACNEIEMVI